MAAKCRMYWDTDFDRSALFNAIPGPWQAQLLATMGMAALPPRFGENDTPTIK